MPNLRLPVNVRRWLRPPPPFPPSAGPGAEEEDTLRGMTGPDGLLANPANPLGGMEKRTRWLPAENVAYGNMSPAKKEVISVSGGGAVAPQGPFARPRTPPHP